MYKILGYSAIIGLWQIFQLWIFVLSREKNSITKATEYVFFGFSFHILLFFPFLGKFERRSFINLTEWRQMRVKCQQLIGDIKHTLKKNNTIFFHECCYGFSQG